MNRQKYILAAVVLTLMAATAALLFHLKTYQRLGKPGVKTAPLANSKNLEILMPVAPTGMRSEILTNLETATLALLPADTSFRSRLYQTDDSFRMQITTVLMGGDRSSIHNPHICLTGQGWAIDDSKSRMDSIPMEQPFHYELPVNKLISYLQSKDENGNPKMYSSVYLYWFVDENQYTASDWKRKAWLVPHDLLTTGVLDRWAYIACFSPCDPGQEDQTCARMKKLIAQLVPEFQLVPHAAR